MARWLTTWPLTYNAMISYLMVGVGSFQGARVALGALDAESSAAVRAREPIDALIAKHWIAAAQAALERVTLQGKGPKAHGLSQLEGIRP